MTYEWNHPVVEFGELIADYNIELDRWIHDKGDEYSTTNRTERDLLIDFFEGKGMGREFRRLLRKVEEFNVLCKKDALQGIPASR